jgi:hypothetical protein
MPAFAASQSLPPTYSTNPPILAIVRMVTDSEGVESTDPVFEDFAPSFTVATKNGAWSQVSDLISELDREIASGVAPIDRWLSLNQTLFFFEEEKLLVDPTQSDLDQHRTWLTTLRRQGEQILALTSCPEKTEIPAQLEILRAKNLGWHGNMSVADASRLLGEVFGGDA